MIAPEFKFVGSPEEVTSGTEVCCNKSYSLDSCNHKKRCKPDFVFKDIIIDTKVGGSLANREQLDRYLEHKSKVYVVTLNDRSKEVQLENGIINIISFSEFLSQSRCLIGVEFGSEWENELTEILKVESIFSIDSE